jgi:hypothetical protein
VEPLPPTFTATREALRAVACYVLGPARKARTGRIALTPVPGGIGTPPFDDGSWIGVRGDQLVVEPGPGGAPLTTLRAAAEAIGRPLDPDPGVGHDLPPFEPDAPLAVDAVASAALAEWYAFGATVFLALGARHTDRWRAGPAQLWPEHFDLALVLEDGDGHQVNVGASPGDGTIDEPYVYVGPWDRSVLGSDPFWNAPFGAVLRRGDLGLGAAAPIDAGAFIDDALKRLD